ncbi:MULTISPECIES: heavy-metal-associated domain-containing protein [Halobacteriovorax]|uniref:Copper chaperone n=1 Tax=Halobacteriovorax vibrionivorans TaxID=2152716 RepID=A0ABY0IHB8_9BACT|nr:MULTISPECIES: heavy-metal-associated domain-containing protein [Halobacteriovorax]AYF43959.1 heavy metal-associated domain protein [Halobacteriovorax sp. BALOs_7]RZF21513.1 copper chaperone [Halobacteriovorax vibrionivorans]TGD48785.1 copper chaperone [Halobacteriovorax sp. Y22]
MKKVKFIVSGIKCGGCVSKVEGGLKDISGISSVDVDVENQEVLVSGESNFSNMQIKTTLSGIGFPVSSIKKLQA